MSGLPLKQLLAVEDPFERRLLLASLLEEALGEKSAIVGGHAVEAYTLGEYTTGDIDLAVFSRARAAAILTGWGFTQQGRTYWHEETGVAVALIGDKLAGDWGRVVEMEVAGHRALLIASEDLIIDRLNACVHWDSPEHCDWAERVAVRQKASLDLTYLRERAAEEGVADALEQILERVDHASDETG